MCSLVCIVYLLKIVSSDFNITAQAELAPDQLLDGDASIYDWDNDALIDTLNNSWVIYQDQNSGWNIGLTMNKSTWSFQPGISSTINIKIKGMSFWSDFIISLSMYDNPRAYFNTSISSDALY